MLSTHDIHLHQTPAAQSPTYTYSDTCYQHTISTSTKLLQHSPPRTHIQTHVINTRYPPPPNSCSTVPHLRKYRHMLSTHDIHLHQTPAAQSPTYTYTDTCYQHTISTSTKPLQHSPPRTHIQTHVINTRYPPPPNPSTVPHLRKYRHMLSTHDIHLHQTPAAQSPTYANTHMLSSHDIRVISLM